jgi:dTDP-4-amino-4,6-dideoxygalactose transaminase
VRPFVPQWADPVWHLYVVGCADRDALRQALQTSRVETIVHYPVAPHMQDAYSAMGFAPEGFPIARRLHDELVSLPSGPHLTTEQRTRVIEVLHATSPAWSRSRSGLNGDR